MKRNRISSECIKSMGYDPDRQLLEVEYPKGSVYQYFKVPEEVYREVLNAPSIGGAWNSIKDYFDYVEVS